MIYKNIKNYRKMFIKKFLKIRNKYMKVKKL